MISHRNIIHHKFLQIFFTLIINSSLRLLLLFFSPRLRVIFYYCFCRLNMKWIEWISLCREFMWNKYICTSRFSRVIRAYWDSVTGLWSVGGDSRARSFAGNICWDGLLSGCANPTLRKTCSPVEKIKRDPLMRLRTHEFSRRTGFTHYLRFRNEWIEFLMNGKKVSAKK